MNMVQHNFTVDLGQTFELFCQGFSIYGPIWEHFLGYWKKSVVEPDKVLFLKYNEIMVEPETHIIRLAEFLGIPFTEEEVRDRVVEEVVRLCSFDNLKSLQVNTSGVSPRFGSMPMENSSFFRKAKVGD